MNVSNSYKEVAGYQITFKEYPDGSAEVSFAGNEILFVYEQEKRLHCYSFKATGDLRIPVQLWHFIMTHLKVLAAKADGRAELVVSNKYPVPSTKKSPTKLQVKK